MPNSFTPLPTSSSAYGPGGDKGSKVRIPSHTIALGSMFLTGCSSCCSCCGRDSIGSSSTSGCGSISNSSGSSSGSGSSSSGGEVGAWIESV